MFNEKLFTTTDLHITAGVTPDPSWEACHLPRRVTFELFAIITRK
jgi:hypothetical protein